MIWNEEKGLHNKQSFSQLAFTGLKEMSEKHLKRFFDLDLNNIDPKEKETLKDFFLTLYASKNFVDGIFGEMIVDVVTPDIQKRLDESDYLQDAMDKILTPFENQVFGGERGEKTDVSLVKLHIRSLISSGIICRRKINFYETFIKEVAAGGALSKDTAEQTRWMIRSMFEDQSKFRFGFYRKVLKEQKISTLYSREEWEKMVRHTMTLTFDNDDFINKVTDVSVLTYVCVSESEYLEFDVKIPKLNKNKSGAAQQEMGYRFGNPNYGIKGLLGVEYVLGSNGTRVAKCKMFVECNLWDDLTYKNMGEFILREVSEDSEPKQATLYDWNRFDQRLEEYVQIKVNVSFE